MTEDERSSLQEQRAFYEAEWDKEQKWRISEYNLRLQVEAERDRLLQQLRSQQLLLEQAARVPNLEKRLADSQSQLIALQERFAELNQFEAIKSQLHDSQAKLEQVQQRVSKETFWRRIAEEFAESVEAFPSLKGNKADSNAELVIAVEAWTLEVLETLTQALDHQNPDLARVKKLLIAQWVLFRWLEITEVIE
jgi:hypothetical protein